MSAVSCRRERDLTAGSGDPAFQVSASATEIFLISFHSTLLGGLKINVIAIDPTNGQRNSHYSLSTEGDISDASDVLHVGANSASPLIAWTDKSHKNLKVNILGSKNTITLPIATESEEVKTVTLHAPRRSHALAHFLVHLQTATQHWAEVYHVDLKKSAVAKAYSLPKVAGKGAFSSGSVDANVFFARVTESEAMLVSSQSHGILERHSLVQAPLKKQPLHVVAEVAMASASSYPTRAALLTEDGEWTMLRNGDALWSRPEYMAHAMAAAIADLPKEQSLEHELETESHQNAVVAFVHRLTRHIQLLINLPTFLQGLTRLSKEGPTGADVTAFDKFGLTKVIMLALPQRKLVAFDTTHPGSPLWSTILADTQDHGEWSGVRLFPADAGFVEVHETGSSVPTVIDALTGKVVGKAASTTDASGHMEAADLYNVRVDEHGLRGYSRQNADTPAWRLTVPPKQRIVALVSRPFEEPVASIGKALGDRRVLYKYLNPNLALLATVDETTNELAVTILDGTSGHVLDTATHNGADGSQPVTAVVSENWFAYSFTTDGAGQAASRGQQLIIGEFYESSLPDDRGSLGASSNYSALGGGSGDSTPYVITRSYQIPEAIAGMTVTQTRQGITSRDVLITLADSKGIVAVPRHILDARRPIGRDPNKDEQAEGLMRYTPTLEFDPKWYLNHQRELFGIKEVITSPSLLESTSIVFAYGLDIFGTRVSPSFTFDILGKGFNKGQMLLTVAALGVAVLLVAPFVCHACPSKQSLFC